MARGYPDYFGQRAVPKYGTPFHIDSGMINLPFGVQTSMLAIAGQGVVNNALIYISGNIPPCNFILDLYVDGIYLFTSSMLEMYTEGFTWPGNHMFHLTEYNTDIDQYTVESGGIVPFSIGYEILIRNNGLGLRLGMVDVFYYLQQTGV